MRIRTLFLLFWIAVLAIFFILSAINPVKRMIWFYEALPGVLLVIFLWSSYRRFPLTSFSYTIIFIGITIMFIGAHYTYAQEPVFNYLQEMFEWKRNNFDRLGHVFFGMIAATIAREYMIRRNWFTDRKWIPLAFILLTLSLSAAYELFEYAAGALSGSDLNNFLGLQGDNWDSHWDMICALTGAIIVWLLGRWQDRQIRTLEEDEFINR